MATTTTSATPAHPPLDPAPPPTTRRAAGWHALLIGAVFAAAYVGLSLTHDLPMMRPDEITYAALARSLSAGHGLTWQGGHVALTSALYVYLIAPVWLVFSDVAAYDAAKVEDVVAACLLAVPIWLVARRLVPGRAALIAVALALSGTWMVTTANIATENLSMPLTTASIGALVVALLRPGGRAWLLALTFAVLACWARLEMVALFPGMLMAVLADVARFGRGWRTRAALHRPLLICLGAVLALGVLLVVVDGQAVTGSYRSVLAYRPTIGMTVRKIGQQTLEIAALTAFAPVLLGVAAALRPRAWRDDVVGPMLAVVLAMSIAFAVESGFYLASYGDGVTWGLQRYAAYPAPWWVLLAVVLAARAYLVSWFTLGATAALSAVLLLTPAPVPIAAGEELAILSTTHRVGALVSGGGAGTAVFVGALVVLAALGAAVLLARWRSWPLAVPVATVLLAALLVQSAGAWQWQIDLVRSARPALPRDLEFVDHHSKGPVGLFMALANSQTFETLEMFNQHITRAYVRQRTVYTPGTPLNGRQCLWTADAAGRVAFERSCGQAPRSLLLQDPHAYVGFQNHISVARDPKAGAVVTPDGPARLLAVVEVPCDRTLAVPVDGAYACGDGIIAHFWLSRPGTLLLHVRGGEINGTIGFRGHTYTVPPLQDSVIRLPLPAGSTHQEFQFNWKELSQAAPQILGVAVEHDGGRVQQLI